MPARTLFETRSRRAVAALLAPGVAALAACTGVLGMDAPTLAPCARGCPDATVADAEGSFDAAAPEEGAADAATDASGGDASSIDGAPDAPPPFGVRCGGGAFPVTYCAGATPVCCQRPADAGGARYVCRATASACDGYPIACASDDDCPGSNICCHFASAMKCEPPSVCPDEQLVCVPDDPRDCPTGWRCGTPLVNDGQTSPYLRCTP